MFSVRTMIVVSAAMHLLVDGLCVCCLYLATAGLAGMNGLVGMFILYNMMAFLTQPLTGIWADIDDGHRKMLLLSVAFLALGCLMVLCVVPRLNGIVGALILAAVLGTGNSLFHVWGGKQTVLAAGNDPRALGTFVSTGALGLAVGMMFASTPLMGAMLTVLVLLSVAYMMLEQRVSEQRIYKQRIERIKRIEGVSEQRVSEQRIERIKRIKGIKGVSEQRVSEQRIERIKRIGRIERIKGIKGIDRAGVATLMVVVLFVVFRSFVSQGFSASAVGGSNAVIVVGLTAMLGKMCGGWLSRWLGMARSMLLVLPVVLCCYLSAALGFTLLLLPGLFAVNTTMPVTLCVANNVLKGREGLAFGLLAAALMPGYLLAML